MIKRIFTAISVSLFYILWLPLAIIKDITALFYIPFDINRVFKTYQQFMNNLYSMTNFHNQLNEYANDIGKQKGRYKEQNIGFNLKVEEDIEETEEIIEEESDN